MDAADADKVSEFMIGGARRMRRRMARGTDNIDHFFTWHNIL